MLATQEVSTSISNRAFIFYLESGGAGLCHPLLYELKVTISVVVLLVRSVKM